MIHPLVQSRIRRPGSKSTYTLRDRELVKFYCLIFIDGLTRGIWGFVPIFIVDLKGSLLDVSLYSTAPGLASTFMQLSWGMTATRHARSRHLWAVCYVVIAVQTVPIAFATQPWHVIFFSTLRGLFAAPMGLASGLFFVSAFRPEVRARFMSIYSSIGWFGATIGALFAGYVIDMLGYRVPFLVFSALNILCAMLILNFAEVEKVDASVSLRSLYREGFTGVKTAYSSLPAWLREEKDYTTYCIGIAIRGLGLALTGPIFTIHLKENLKAESAQIGELSALNSLVRMVATPALGWIADLRSRKQVFLVCVFLAMLHPILFVTRSAVSQLYPLYVMSGLFWACIESVWFAWQMDIIPERRGIYMAILSFFNGTEWAIGPMLGSFLGETFGFFQASVVAAAAIGLGFWRLTKVPEHLRKRGDGQRATKSRCRLSYVGIDLAGSTKRPTGYCVLRGMFVRTELLHFDEEIIDRTSRASPRVIAIDAPLALPRGRHCLEEHCRGRPHFRDCDRKLRALGIRFFPITLGPMRLLTSRGISLKAKLEEAGFQVVETYPGGAQDLLGIKRRSDLEGLRSGLRGLGITGDVDRLEATAHELDAITCAYVAKLHAEGEAMSLGDPAEILMILPKPSGILK